MHACFHFCAVPSATSLCTHRGPALTIHVAVLAGRPITDCRVACNWASVTCVGFLPIPLVQSTPFQYLCLNHTQIYGLPPFFFLAFFHLSNEAHYLHV
jgi:hypothetical protein